MVRRTNDVNKLPVRVLALALTSIGACSAGTIFGTPAPLSGTVTAEDIVAAGGYASPDLTLTWVVSQDGQFFDYSYTITGYTTPSIGHFILSVSGGCSADPNCITGDAGHVFGSYTATSNGNSNPGFPSQVVLDGVKFASGSADSSTYTFTSDRAPVFGDFYFTGGQTSWAYDPGLSNPSSTTITDFIARPDTVITNANDVFAPTQAPEPGSLFLFGGGAILVALGRKKFTRTMPINHY